MTLHSLFAAVCLTLGSATLALADGVVVKDAYLRASGAAATSGAAFMAIENQGETGDRLIAATSDIAERVELHTHIMESNGVMRMVEVEGGIEIPAGSTHDLARGGDHIMFMGLKSPLKDGDKVKLTLTFESGALLDIEVPVDNKR